MTDSATRAWTVGLTAIGSVMAALDTLVVAAALSTIRVDLGATVEQLEWTVNAYNLSFAVLMITAAATTRVSSAAITEPIAVRPTVQARVAESVTVRSPRSGLGFLPSPV